jgi:hypothetical protein
VFDWSPDLTAMPAIIIVTGVWLAASAGLVVGYRARLSAAALCALTVLMYVADQNLWANHQYFLGLVTLLLALTESDAALSVRPRDGGAAGSPATITAWPVTLLKIQLSIVYFFTAVAKVNPVFLSGASLADHRTMVAALAPPVAFAGLAVATVVSEFTLSFALWVKPLRWGAIALGLVLHGLAPAILGYYAGLIIFSVLAVSLYPLFLDQSDLDLAVETARLGGVDLRPVFNRRR